MGNTLKVQAHWHDKDKRIIKESLTEGWDWEDWRLSSEHVIRLAHSVSEGSVLIGEIPSDVGLPPQGFSENVRYLLDCHAAAGVQAVIYVTRNSALVTLFEQAITRFAQDASRYHFVRTFAEAESLVCSTT